MFSVLGEELSQPKWVVDFLLPNGIMITHTVDKEASLAFIKEVSIQLFLKSLSIHFDDLQVPLQKVFFHI